MEEEQTKTLNTWIQKASMHEARTNHATEVLNGKIYAIGGEMRRTVEEYNPETNTWTQKASMDGSRAGHTTEVLNGKIYAIGGFSLVYSPIVEEYNPETDKWTRKASMHEARCNHTTEVLNGKIYAIGGENNSGDLSTVEEYNPETDTWIRKANMYEARTNHTTEVLDGKIYVIGGRGSGSLSTVEEYNPKTNTWIHRESMYNARDNHTTEVLNRKIYAIGGENRRTVEEYNPETNTWTQKASMNELRSYHTTEMINGKIYAIGGRYSTFLPTVEEYNPETNTWTQKTSMNEPRSYHTTEVLNGKIYAVGGQSGGNILLTVEEYTPSTNNISNIAINKTSLNMIVGNSDTLIATTTPANVGITWSSSDDLVATVNQNGKVTAIKEGQATITATIADGSNLSASCIVTVTLNPIVVPPSSAVVLSIEPEKPQIHLKERVLTNLVIDNIKEIAAEEVKIKYDNTKLKFLGVNEIDRIKLVKPVYKDGELRFILANKGAANITNAKKVLLTLKFQGIASGDALVDITKGKVSDGITMEKDLTDAECGQAIIKIDNTVLKDVNNTGEFTLLDLAIDARHLGEDPTTLTQYNTDQVINGKIDDDDLIKISEYMLANPN